MSYASQRLTARVDDDILFVVQLANHQVLYVSQRSTVAGQKNERDDSSRQPCPCPTIYSTFHFHHVLKSRSVSVVEYKNQTHLIARLFVSER